MLWQNVNQWVTVMLIVSLASLAALPVKPISTPKQELETDGNQQTSGTKYAVDAAKECSTTSTLLYAETVVVLKDDPTSLINGTIAISIGSPVTIECVRIVAKTDRDRMALHGYRFVSPTVVEVTVAELPPIQSTGLEYTVYVYGSVGSKQPKLKKQRFRENKNTEAFETPMVI